MRLLRWGTTRRFCRLALTLGPFGRILIARDLWRAKTFLWRMSIFVGRIRRTQSQKKALRVNLSDIAAMGATPLGYLLGCAWPKGVREEYVALFAEGLRQDQSAYRLTAFGGDTTAHADPAAPLVVSVTAFGAAPQSGVLRRSGARPGDDVYVSGTIGDAGLGLDVHRARVVGTDAESLANRYLLPQPRLALGRSLAGVAAAAIDVSDGLLADAGHIAEQSGVRIDVDIDNAPLSPAARAWLDRQPNRREAIGFLLSCGDDYELLFTARPEQRKAIAEAAAAAATPVRRIGRVGEGEGVATIDSAGDEVFLPKSGFDHFASS